MVQRGRRRLWAARFATSALVAALVGCGGSTLGAQELRSRATAVCSSATRRVDAIGAPTSPAAGRLFLSQGVAVLRPELGALRALHPPHDLAGTYATSVGALGQIVATLGATATALAGDGDPVAAFRTLEQQLAPIEAQQNQGWQTLGIPACVIH